MSSSRVQTVFTGNARGLGDVDRLGHERALRIPAPPEAAAEERRVHLHLVGGRPVMPAAVICSIVWNCDPVQISQVPFASFTVQLRGSIVACARNGTSYSASRRFAADASAASGSPALTAWVPGDLACAL